MSDLAKNPNCWFSHAKAYLEFNAEIVSCVKKNHIKCFCYHLTAEEEM